MTHRMFAQIRFFDFSRFAVGDVPSRVRSAFEPRKPRHRLLRFALGLVGLTVVVMLVMLGVVVGASMLAVGLVYKLFARRAKPVARDPRIVDAEYRVVDKSLLSR